MYNWRKMNEEQREDLLTLRKSQKRPWHSPPHIQGDKTRFIISSACYEHKDIIGVSPERISLFESEFLDLLHNNTEDIHAWCVLPNHYHALLKTGNVLILLKKISQFHGRISFLWNGEEGRRGRRVWCNTLEKTIKSERHFQAAMNYIHHNPVKHGYVKKWTDWPYSSAAEYLEKTGRDQALKTWREYDISGMGKDWDEYEDRAETVNSNGQEKSTLKL